MLPFPWCKLGMPDIARYLGTFSSRDVGGKVQVRSMWFRTTLSIEQAPLTRKGHRVGQSTTVGIRNLDKKKFQETCGVAYMPLNVPCSLRKIGNPRGRGEEEVEGQRERFAETRRAKADARAREEVELEGGKVNGGY
nr:hypothetical protein CFP56_65502 [Quercus suber]